MVAQTIIYFHHVSVRGGGAVNGALSPFVVVFVI